MKITIIGTGNVALLHAPYLSEMGHSVTLLKTSNLNMELFHKINADKGYLVNGFDKVNFHANIDAITVDFAAAIDSAELILVTTTTLQHEDIAKRISPFVKDGQIIALMPSYAGSRIFKKYINKALKFVEFETSVYNGRIINNEYVNVSFENCRVAAYFENFTQSEKESFKKVFFKIDLERTSPFEVAFHNPNMIVHTIGVLLSSSRIEYSKGEFWMYKEAFTPSVINVINKFDEEKNLILEALGCQELNYFEAAKWRNEIDLSKDALEVFKSFSEETSKGPGSLKHRYLLEDVPMGLVLFESVGRCLNIETPMATAIINLTGALLGLNFRKQGNMVETI